jgi:hypothetical protein
MKGSLWEGKEVSVVDLAGYLQLLGVSAAGISRVEPYGPSLGRVGEAYATVTKQSQEVYLDLLMIVQLLH